MPSKIKLFRALYIETQSSCNRMCPTCPRQTDPTRSRWNKDGTQINVKLPTKTIVDIINQAADLGFRGNCWFFYANEPLLDSRLVALCRYAKKKGLKPGITTNGDLLTPKLAKELDSVLMTPTIIIDIYDYPKWSPEKRRAKMKYLRGLFPKRRVIFNWSHITVHHSRRKNLQALIALARNKPCMNKIDIRMVIDYKGEMLLCCEDIAGNWNLGNVKEYSLKELWYSPKHIKIVQTLSKPSGRLKYPYCRICPRVSN